MSAMKAPTGGPESEKSPAALPSLKPGLLELGSLFCRVGSLTFGGGNPTTVALQYELIERRGWLDQTTFAVCYAFSRLTPGTNLLAFCTAAGWTVRKWPGALVALLAASLPCSAIAVLFTFLYGSANKNQFVAIAIRGMLASAVGILLASSWELVRPYLSTTQWLRTAVVFAGSIILAVGFRMSPIPIILLSALLGFAWQRHEERA
jgi:chromate transporter